MKKTAPWILLALVIASAAVLKAVERETPGGEMQISYLDATDAAQALVRESPELADALTRIDMKRNAILLEVTSPSYEAAVKKLMEIDQPPKQVIYKVEISELVEKGEETTERVLSRPTLHVLEGQPAVITHEFDNGKTMKISVVSSVKPLK